MCRAMTIALGVMMLGVVASSAMAAWPTSPNESLPVCTALGVQSDAQLVSDGAGGVIVTWKDSRSGAWNIYAQHVLPSGNIDPLWPADGRALCAVASGQYYPQIVFDGAGGAIVTWMDQRDGIFNIYAQHVLASGAIDPAWPTGGRALCTAANGQYYPQIATDGSGGAIVAWKDYRNGIWNIYAQRVLVSGLVDPSWPADGRALCVAAIGQEAPKIVSDGTGGAIVTWADYRAGQWDIYAQHVLASGAVDPAWPIDGRALCTTGSDQYSPQIVSDGAGGGIVVWLDQRGGTWDIYAQHVLPSGALDPMWPIDGLGVCLVANTQHDQQVAPDGAGGAIVTWADWRSGESDIYAQHVLAEGTVDPSWPRHGKPLSRATGAQQYPQIVSDGTGGAVVTWTDGRSGNADVYAQRVLPSGASDLNWGASGNPVGVTFSGKFPTRPVVGANDEVFVAWADESSTDIHAQRFDLGGAFGNPSPKILKILDVPNDQGGRAKLLWSASQMEGVGLVGVDRYWILRSVPEPITTSSRGDVGRLCLLDDPVAQNEAKSFRTSAYGVDYYWEFVVEQPAFHQQGYSYVASTTSDSLPGSNPYTLFMIMARNSTGTEYWFSKPDSGYSVDNLSPPTPSPFVAQYQGSAVALHWTVSSATDFKEFRLYRVPTAATVPEPEHLLSSSPDTGFVDHPPIGAGDVYKLAAVDVHGNVSRFAIVTPASPVSTLAALVSANWTESGAELVWFGGALAGTAVTVHREEGGQGWSEIATLSGDGEGFVRYTDAEVLPGHRYGYRLRFMESGEERFAGTAYIEIPAGRLAIQSVAPNPVTSDRLSLRVSLAETGPARVRVLDLAGRIVREQQVPTSLTGQFDVSLSGGSPLRPGVYIVELRQGGSRATTRFTYLR